MNKGHRGQHNYYPQQSLPDIVHLPGAQPNQSALTAHGLQAMQSMQAPQQIQQVNAVHTQRPRFQTTHAGNRRHNSPALMPPRQTNVVPYQPAISSQANQAAYGYQIPQRQLYNNAQYFVVQHPIPTTEPAFAEMHQPSQNVQVRSTWPSSFMTQHGSNTSKYQPSGSYPFSSETPIQNYENMVSYQPQHRPPEPKRERKRAVIQDPNSGHAFTEQELKNTEPVRQDVVLSEPQDDSSSSRNTPSNQNVISSSEAALEFRDKVSAAAASVTYQAGQSAAVENHLRHGAAFVEMHQPPQNVQVRSRGLSSLMTQHGSNMSISQPSGFYSFSCESNENMDLKEIFSSVKSSSDSDNSTLNDRKSMKLNKFDKFFDMIAMKVQQNESTECIIELIEKNFQAHETKDLDFVSALTKAVVKGCKKLYCENEEKREAKSLLALQDLSEELQHPSKLLGQMFQYLFEENVISQDVFLKGAVMACKQFLTWFRNRRR
ncbi:hypothetical protein B4U79_18511 [Dinothrombium tinctorium]|uniref:Eukaryotic translation initiation factor 4 gamma 3-like protein n=1 Tax=Dinothrombium tinctorium TaxID=1965070 RepID=A0A3S3P6Q1_9ACAR|nr:hypothetical protein B4U79_18511 [Dinothrombium tinctorium]